MYCGLGIFFWGRIDLQTLRAYRKLKKILYLRFLNTIASTTNDSVKYSIAFLTSYNCFYIFVFKIVMIVYAGK